jgi:hypothetical protein
MPRPARALQLEPLDDPRASFFGERVGGWAAGRSP